MSRDRLQDRIANRVRRCVLRQFEERLELFESERIAVLVLRFDDSVGKINERIAFLQIDLHRPCANLGADAEGK